MKPDEHLLWRLIRPVALCLLLCTAGSLRAQDNELDAYRQAAGKYTYWLAGAVSDYVTRQPLLGVRTEILRPDSTLIYGFSTRKGFGTSRINPAWMVPVPEPGRYILRFAKEGYETVCVDYEVTRFRKRETTMTHAPILMRRPAREQVLNEAVVKATRVKFYAKGDTLVFNADAFRLSEGSMLDALIRQLPGVELKDDGRILVNGRYVENLLLNGEDFFGKDRTIMLDNLPTYMVKTVEVYEKEGKLSEMLGRNMNDESLVMDVKLKKQYAIGWTGNAEVAGGTADRYLARLFGLRFSDHSRLSVFGALDNVNDYTKPGAGREWTPQVGAGTATSRRAGVDYLVDDRRKRFKLRGNAELKHSDALNEESAASVSFVTGGDTYGRSRYANRSHYVALNSDHTFDFNFERAKVQLKPSVAYSRQRQHTAEVSATFGADPETYVTTDVLDSLFAPGFDGRLAALTLNRYRNDMRQNGHSLTTALYTTTTLNMLHSNDRLVIEANGNFADAAYRSFAQKLYDYPANAATTAADFRNEYTDSPSRSYFYTAKLTYFCFLQKPWTIMPSYQYWHDYARKDNALYRLDELPEFGQGTTHEPGVLPSVTGWEQQTLDGRNSLFTRETNDYHVIDLKIYRQYVEPTCWNAMFKLPLSIDRNSLDYSRPAVTDTVMTRHKVYFRPGFSSLKTWNVRNAEGKLVASHDLEVTYDFATLAQPLSYFVNMRDDRNPLAVTLGNPDLKNYKTHKVGLTYDWNRPGKQRMVGVTAHYNLTQDALVMGYVYDRSTGVRTYTPDNVNGNWSADARVNFTTPVDRRRRLTLNVNSSATYNNSVDLTGIEGESAAVRSSVRNLYVTQGLKLDWGIDGLKLGLKGNGTWTHAESRRADFTTVNAVDFSYGMTALATLPAGFELATDLTVYSRRGYEAAEMNTDDVVWNARLSRRFFKNRLSVVVDGFDILGQLSNVRRTLNAQGRVETWYNTVPRYAMLRLIYRLNVQPKRR